MILENGSIINDPLKIANNFNEYFASIGPTSANNIHNNSSIQNSGSGSPPTRASEFLVSPPKTFSKIKFPNL